MKHQFSRFISGSALAVLTFSANAAEPAQNPIGHFEITRFEVDGNTLLDAQAMQELLVPFTGKERDFGSVQRALEALEDAYRQRGFSVVHVILPEQELNQGVVRLKVVEPRIGKVTVTGNQFFDETNIRRSLPGLHEGDIPNFDVISASLRMANENPSKKVTMQLQSDDNDDKINATLKVDDSKPWNIGATVDNTGNSSTGNDHLSVLYQNNNVAGLDQVLSLQYTTTVEKPSKVSVYGFGYHIPLYALGDSLDFFGSYSNVDSGSVAAGLLDLQISGKGSVLGTRYNQSLLRRGAYESKLIYGLDYRAYQNSVQLQALQLGSDVTVHPFSIGYSGAWSVAPLDVNFNASAVRNLPGGSNGDDAAFGRVRLGAPAAYQLLRYGANVMRLIGNDWQAHLVLNGQYSRDSLVPGEQFGAGGASSVRGFTEREIADDSGYFGSAEIYTPNLCTTAQCRLLFFYDGAQLQHNNGLPGERSQTSISSIGLGLRWVAQKYFSLQMDYGHVLQAGDAPVSSKGSNRLHFRMNLSY